MRWLTVTTAALFALTMIAAGCGGSGGETEPEAAEDTTAAVDTLPEPEYVASPQADSLIPREALFGNPEHVLP
ncbi:MAG: hypothetical protein ACQETZ_07245, partial [Candidatus Fermentibacterota bacterium]